MRYYIGIDPGKSGGIAVIKIRSNSKSGLVMDYDLLCNDKVTERDLFEWLSVQGSMEPEWGAHRRNVFAFIEKVGGYVGGGEGEKGGGKANGSAMFTFGQSYGMLRMALVAAGIPFAEVLPKAWQKGCGVPPKAKTETRTQWKNRLKQRAQQLYPKCPVTLATSDALLIAHYCRSNAIFS